MVPWDSGCSAYRLEEGEGKALACWRRDHAWSRTSELEVLGRLQS